MNKNKLWFWLGCAGVVILWMSGLFVYPMMLFFPLLFLPDGQTYVVGIIATLCFIGIMIPWSGSYHKESNPLFRYGTLFVAFVCSYGLFFVMMQGDSKHASLVQEASQNAEQMDVAAMRIENYEERPVYYTTKAAPIALQVSFDLVGPYQKRLESTMFVWLSGKNPAGHNGRDTATVDCTPDNISLGDDNRNRLTYLCMSQEVHGYPKKDRPLCLPEAYTYMHNGEAIHDPGYTRDFLKPETFGVESTIILKMRLDRPFSARNTGSRKDVDLTDVIGRDIPASSTLRNMDFWIQSMHQFSGKPGVELGVRPCDAPKSMVQRGLRCYCPL